MSTRFNSLPASRRLALVALGAIVLIALAALGQRALTQVVAPAESVPEIPTAGTPVDPPRVLRDFTLTDQEGQPMRLSDLRGRLALLFFGYTSCPDVCPTTLVDFAQVKRLLGDQSSQVAFVFISVDGTRDTPAVLKRYVKHFDKDFIGMTGPEDDVRRIGADYGLYFERQPLPGSQTGYSVDHTAVAYLVDREGRMIMLYGYGTPASVIGADLQKLLSGS